MQKNPKPRLAPRLWVFCFGSRLARIFEHDSKVVPKFRADCNFGVITLRNPLRKLHHAAHAAYAPGGN